MQQPTCCAECGKEEGGGLVSLKACKSCRLVKYCNAECQHNHWPTHKKTCKLRAAELRDEALFKDPPPKEDCPICFLPMPAKLIHCISLPPATITSVPINDFAIANEELAKSSLEKYYPCCGKSICEGCIYSFVKSENIDKCPFCNSDLANKTEEEEVEDILKRVAVNDPNALCVLADRYEYGEKGFPQDRTKAMELYARAVDLGSSGAHNNLGVIYHEGGNLKKAKFHSEAAAMAGHDEARYNVGSLEANSGNLERAVKHWIIAASAGYYRAMHHVRIYFELGVISRKSIDSTLTAYNSSCAEMRSEARDACIHCQLTRL